MAHIPLIHGPDGAKLSKRHGALGVDAYRAMGYLPAAMRNYLVRLGWSHGDDEVFSTEQMIEWFELDAIGRSPARFDFAKLENLNGIYIRMTPDEELMALIEETLPHLPAPPAFASGLDEARREKLRRALPGLKERAKTLIELLDGAAFLFAERPLTLDEKAGKLLAGEGREVLAGLLPRLERAEWSADALETEVRHFAEQTDRKLGAVAQPLRAALSGRAVSPPIFDVLVVLGREESLARIRDQAPGGT